MNRTFVADELAKVAKDLIADTPETVEEAVKRINWNLGYIKDALVVGEMMDVNRALSRLKEAEKYLLIIKKIEDKQSQAKGPVKDAIEAYGDSNNLPTRKLNWRGQFVSGNEVIEVAKAAVAEGYNEWTPAIFERAIKSLPGNYKYAFAREGSVCVYVMGFSTPEEALNIAQVFQKAKADEVAVQGRGRYESFEKGIPKDFVSKSGDMFRAWWD